MTDQPTDADDRTDLADRGDLCARCGRDARPVPCSPPGTAGRTDGRRGRRRGRGVRRRLGVDRSSSAPPTSRPPSTSPAATSTWPTASGSRCAPGRSGWSSGRAPPDPDRVDLGRVAQDDDLGEPFAGEGRRRPVERLARNRARWWRTTLSSTTPGRPRRVPGEDRLGGQVEARWRSRGRQPRPPARAAPVATVGSRLVASTTVSHPGGETPAPARGGADRRRRGSRSGRPRHPRPAPGIGLTTGPRRRRSGVRRRSTCPPRPRRSARPGSGPTMSISVTT